MEYNARKLVVLYAVYELEEATVSDVWEAMDDDVSLSGIGMSLLRYRRQGMLNRRGGKEKIYEITNKGLERLEWLENLYEADENEEGENEEDYEVGEIEDETRNTDRI